MIDINQQTRQEAMDYALEMTESNGAAIELYEEIMSLLYEIERNDDKDGTDTLERLLYSSESLSIAEIVEEYGIIG